MCIVCLEWEKGKLTSTEALRNLGEMIESTDKEEEKRAHYFEVVEKILDKEVPTSDGDEDLDKKWHEQNYED